MRRNSHGSGPCAQPRKPSSINMVPLAEEPEPPAELPEPLALPEPLTLPEPLELPEAS